MTQHDFCKKVYEEFTINGDFTANLTANEVLTGRTVIATDKDGNNVSDTVLNQATVADNGAGVVSVLVLAGALEASPYKIRFRCVTSDGHKWALGVKMRVVD